MVLRLRDGGRGGPLSVGTGDDLSRFDGQGPLAEAIKRILQQQQGNPGPQSINEIAREGIAQRSPDGIIPQLQELAGIRAGANIGANIEAPAASAAGPLTNYIKDLSSEVKQIASRTTPVVEPTGPVPDELMERLYGILESTGGGAIDTAAYEAAMADQRRAIRQGYRGQIQGRKENQRVAQERGAKDRSEVDKMYDALAATYARARDRESNRGQRAADLVTDRAARTNERLAESAKEQNAELVAIAQGLGAEGLVEQTIDEITARDSETAGRIAREGSRSADRLVSQGEAARQRLASDRLASRREGNQTISGMLESEEDYVRGLDDEIASLRAARRQDIAGNRASVAQTLAQIMGQSQNNMFQQALALAQFQNQRENQEAERAMKMAQLQMQDPLEDARDPDLAAYEAAMGTVSPEAAAIANSVANSETFGMRKGPGGISVAATPQSIAALLRAEAEARGVRISEEELSNLVHGLYRLSGTTKLPR